MWCLPVLLYTRENFRFLNIELYSIFTAIAYTTTWMEDEQRSNSVMFFKAIFINKVFLYVGL